MFHFHAYFPFPQRFYRDKVEKDAFLRAVALLAANSSSQLQEDTNKATRDTHRDHQANHLWRMFRSFYIPQIASNLSTEDLGTGNSPDWFEGEDLLDVLSLVQHLIHFSSQHHAKSYKHTRKESSSPLSKILMGIKRFHAGIS